MLQHAPNVISLTKFVIAGKYGVPCISRVIYRVRYTHNNEYVYINNWNFAQEKILRNKVNRAATKLRYEFYQKHVTALRDTGSHDWWKNMKKLMGIEANDSSKMQGLANKVADGNCEMLANSMNDLLCLLANIYHVWM